MRKLLLPLLMLLAISTFGQYTKENAKEDLQQLKNGTLLVRLKTNEASISALEAQGREKEAERMKERLYQENKEILLSFTNAFDFCKVYFFYAPSSEDIRKGNFEGHVFNAQRIPVHPDSLAGTIYTAEFSETENLGIKGLIVMDGNLFPLKSPFPFYQRKYIALGLIAHSKAKMIDLYNQKLHSTFRMWFPEEDAVKATP